MKKYLVQHSADYPDKGNKRATFDNYIDADTWYSSLVAKCFYVELFECDGLGEDRKITSLKSILSL